MNRIRLMALMLTALGVGMAAIDRPRAASRATIEFGDAFWKVWGDGRGELSGYDLTFPRYGKARRGTAVTIFVTETFSGSDRVKADPGRHPREDEYPVMKLNLVQDFPTGIYDYNLMTSVFVQLEEANGLPRGSVTKVSFSAQEWCGHVYEQLLFDAGAARLVSHSYFDGEADREEKLKVPANALAEDVLPLWARGFAAPAVARGETRRVPLVRSLVTARLEHVPVTVQEVVLSRAAATRRIHVPAGDFEVETFTAAIPSGRRWTFSVEAADPRRLVAWETSDGVRAELLGGDRLEYWRMNGGGFESELTRLGLSPRPGRVP